MTDPLETELDLLFQLPPTELVPARNALAAKLKQAGNREAAKRVSSLKRPSPGAWAINQVHFREPALLERATEQAAALRELTAADGVDSRQLSAAVDAQRSATQAIVDAAVRYCDALGLSGGPPQQRKIFTTVQGWLSGKADEPPGRMTHDLEPSGFDVIGSVGLVLPQSAPPRAATGAVITSIQSRVGGAARATSHEPARTKPPEPDPREVARATDQLAKSERAARTAGERTKERVTERKQTELELERARLQVKDAERALVHLRAAVTQREAAHAKAQAAVEEAEADRAQAEEAVELARTELAKLRGHRSGSK
jgi:hypothetical protein